LNFFPDLHGHGMFLGSVRSGFHANPGAGFLDSMTFARCSAKWSIEPSFACVDSGIEGREPALPSLEIGVSLSLLFDAGGCSCIIISVFLQFRL
jgi:hypothetical protein